MALYKGGYAAAKAQRVAFKLQHYQSLAKLPDTPKRFGHLKFFTEWGWLGNDRLGNCVPVAAAHQTMYWVREQGKLAPFNEKTVISDYSRATGYNPAQPWTDQGMGLVEEAEYWKAHGILAASGHRYAIKTYVGLTRGCPQEMSRAAHLLGGVGCGFLCPRSAMTQFDKGQPWDVVPNDGGIVVGHCVPILARDDDLYWCVTWNRWQAMTAAFYQSYAVESLAYISLDRLKMQPQRRGPPNYWSPEGYNLGQLMTEIQTIGCN